jgi:gas vesicle protein
MSTDITPGSETDPEVIRAQIENTRRELGTDVDALADKVDPNKIVQRQTDKVKGAFGSVKDRVMGTASDAGQHLSGTADGATDLAHRAAAQAKGNPLAVGLIAFGVGWLASSLIPATGAEKKIAANVKEAAEPLAREAADAAKQVGENLKQPLADAAEAVKGTATDAAQNVKSETQSSAGAVRDEAKHAGGSTGL